MMLSLRHVRSWYGEMQVLHGVSLDVKTGEIVSVIGPNGAGKSTVLKSIFGLVKKREGSIRFMDKDLISLPSDAIARLGIAYVPQGRSVFSSLSVQENLDLAFSLRSSKNVISLEHVYRHFPRLKERRHQKAGLLSGGEQQMVSIGRALLLEPQLLVLDEPSLGLSPQLKKMILANVKRINKEEGLSVLMVEQNARMALDISDRAYVLETGRNKLTGTGKQLLKSKDVQKLYLGGVA